LSHSLIFQQYQHSVTVLYNFPKPTQNNILKLFSGSFLLRNAHPRLSNLFLSQYNARDLQNLMVPCTYGHHEWDTASCSRWSNRICFSCQLKDGVTIQRHIKKNELLESVWSSFYSSPLCYA